MFLQVFQLRYHAGKRTDCIGTCVCFFGDWERIALDELDAAGEHDGVAVGRDDGSFRAAAAPCGLDSGLAVCVFPRPSAGFELDVSSDVREPTAGARTGSAVCRDLDGRFGRAWRTRGTLVFRARVVLFHGKCTCLVFLFCFCFDAQSGRELNFCERRSLCATGSTFGAEFSPC